MGREQILDLGHRSISDFFLPVHELYSKWKYLYFCKNCSRNFDSLKRIEKCPKCDEHLLELPKEEIKATTKPDAQEQIYVTANLMKKKVLKDAKNFKTKIFPKVKSFSKINVKRAKIAFHYLSTTKPKFEK